MDFKEFWIDKLNWCQECGDHYEENLKQDLGLFFWERGGKQFVEEYACDNVIKEYSIEDAFDTAYELATFSKDEGIKAQDFLFCVACLGEEQVKELIKKVGCEKQ